MKVAKSFLFFGLLFVMLKGKTFYQDNGHIYNIPGKFVELCELAGHPWMVSCQFHPEFGSRPTRPHPLFRDFIGAAKDILREGAQQPLPFSP